MFPRANSLLKLGFTFWGTTQKCIVERFNLKMVFFPLYMPFFPFTSIVSSVDPMFFVTSKIVTM
jgi:hypothetical protein